MSNIIKILLILLFLSYHSSLVSQERYFELGAGIGLANYSGDLSPTNVSQILGTSRFAGTGYLRYNLHPHVNLKLSGTYAKIQGRDSYSDKPWQIERNLSFFTDIYELGLTGELNLFKYIPLNGENIFTIYVTGGIAGFYFNPLAELDGQIYELQPLGTEGQGLAAYPDRQPYSLFEIAVPFGGGIKFKISESVNFNMEMAWRLTFTDYLDDVSRSYPDYNLLLEQRGETVANLSNRTGEILGETRIFSENARRGGADVDDYYFLITVGLSYNIVNYNSTGGYNKVKRRRSKYNKCPKF